MLHKNLCNIFLCLYALLPQRLQAFQQQMGVVDDMGKEVVGECEGVTACEKDLQVGVAGKQMADVALCLEAGAVDGARHHRGFGVLSHEGGVGFCLKEWQQGGVFVHGSQSQLDARGDDAANQFTLTADEVVGDAGACIDNEQGVVGFSCPGSQVGSQSVGTIFWGYVF